ncbi:MAG: DUF1289 domain-containing protein [Sterolibacteriaceae bacterium]|nr:DUF1289 domain-containing protein [Sterolibacteriaceae bacterium]MBK9087087.1 DUF1289 domain-containing protein [Sterolibacteriaceae bacterium]
MNQPVDGSVPSPCINVCKMNKRSGLCEGCLRTLDEIAMWGQASDPQKLVILAQLVERREAAVSLGCEFD